MPGTNGSLTPNSIVALAGLPPLGDTRPTNRPAQTLDALMQEISNPLPNSTPILHLPNHPFYVVAFVKPLVIGVRAEPTLAGRFFLTL